MATLSQPLPIRARLRPKLFLFAFIGMMMAYVLYHNERFLIDPSAPVWAHYQPFKWWLLPHGLAGACALFLGPMQFSERLRQRYLRMHRIVGWFYVAGAMVLAPLGSYIQFFQERMGAPRSFSIAATADAALLMLTTGIAFWFALRRKIAQHRQWMTRSYAVALVFLEVRVISGLGGWDNSLQATETIVWTCLIFAVPLADIVLQWQDFRRSKPVAKTRAMTA
jgi:hypothetical protein